MLNVKNLLGRSIAQKLATAAFAAASVAGIASPAMARDNVTVDIRVDTKDRCEERRVKVWIPAEVRTVCDKVWIEPVYEDRCSKVWVEPVFEDRCDKVWVPPVYETRCEKVWHEPVVETRCVTRWDPICRKYVQVHERVVVQAGHFDEVRRQVCVSEGRWQEVRNRVCVREGRFEEVRNRVCVREGRWQTVERQEVVREGYWGWKTERVRVADNDRRAIEVVNPHIRF